MNMFDRFDSRTVIRATLEMHTALSVGGRASLQPNGTDLPVVRNADGMPFIPGSSLKGVVRAQMERVLRSVHQKPDFWACDPFGDPCVKSDLKDQLMREVEALPEDRREKEFTQRVWNKTCTVCRLFGSPWIASRLAFKDAFLQNAEDHELWQLGLLATTLEAMNQGLLKMGFGKNRGFGQVQATVKQAQIDELAPLKERTTVRGLGDFVDEKQRENYGLAAPYTLADLHEPVETQRLGFYLQRSYDGTGWQAIARKASQALE